MKRHLNRQTGLSLIELMVAMLISLLLLGGVVQVFLSSKKLYSTNTALARVQENGRFATDFLTFDIRQAGYKGECINAPVNHLDTTSSDYVEDLFDMSTSIKGWDDDTAAALISTRLAKTDAILIKYGAPLSSGADVNTGNSNPANANSITLDASANVPTGTLLLVANSKGCDLFQKTNNANSNSLTKGSGTIPGNSTGGAKQDWSHAYSNEDIQILTLQSFVYYINTGTNGIPSLYRINANNGNSQAEELVEGAMDLQVTYGIDKNGDRQADEYVKAGTNNLNDAANNSWETVVSARISVLVVAPETNIIDTQQVFFFPAAKGISTDNDFATYVDGTVTVKQNRLAQVFTTTVAVRNRLP